MRKPSRSVREVVYWGMSVPCYCYSSLARATTGLSFESVLGNRQDSNARATRSNPPSRSFSPCTCLCPGRVEDWRGTPEALPWPYPPFPASCPVSFAVGPAPVPAHQTERADFPHSDFLLASPHGLWGLPVGSAFDGAR